MEPDPIDDEVLSRLNMNRRELVRRLVAGTAFAVPVVASFDMSSLTVSSADATSANQVAPAITSGTSTTFKTGAPGQFDVTATGVPSPTISESGQLPPSVQLTDNGNGSATLGGTPPLGSEGAYDITIIATNTDPQPTTQAFTLVVDQPPAITSAATIDLLTGEAAASTVTTTGYPPPALSVTGSLPPGVTFTDNSDGTATIGGTPAASGAGDHALSITATNGVAPDATQSITVTVQESPAFTNPAGTAFTSGRQNTFTVITSGFPLAVISESGGLPSGVTFTDNGNGTATLAGTPPAGANGSYRLSLVASNGVGAAAIQQFALSVTEIPTPVITIRTPAPGARYRYRELVRAAFSVSDPDGIGSVQSTVENGSPLDTRSPGRQTFKVTARSNDGVTAAAAVSYRVLPPDNDFTVSNIHTASNGTITFSVDVPGPGAVAVLATAWKDEFATAATWLQPAANRFGYGRTTAVARRPEKLHLKLEPNHEGRRLVRDSRYRVTLRLWVTFTPTGGGPRSEGFYGIHVPGRAR